jgi:hypothetical protein
MQAAVDHSPGARRIFQSPTFMQEVILPSEGYQRAGSQVSATRKLSAYLPFCWPDWPLNRTVAIPSYDPMTFVAAGETSVSGVAY